MGVKSNLILLHQVITLLLHTHHPKPTLIREIEKVLNELSVTAMS